MLPNPLIADVLCIGEDGRRRCFAEPSSDGETRRPCADNQYIVDYYRHVAIHGIQVRNEKMMGRYRRHIDRSKSRSIVVVVDGNKLLISFPKHFFASKKERKKSFW